MNHHQCSQKKRMAVLFPTLVASILFAIVLLGITLPSKAYAAESIPYTTQGCDPSFMVASDTATLNSAISCYNGAGPGNYVINVTADITLDAATTVINNTAPGATLLIAGAGHVIDGDNAYRIFTVQSSAVTLDDLTLQNGKGVAECSGTCGGAVKLKVGRS